MTRFNISLSEGVSYVMWAIDNSYGGEIIVPKLRSFKITDLARAIDPTKKMNLLVLEQVKKFMNR